MFGFQKEKKRNIKEEGYWPFKFPRKTLQLDSWGLATVGGGATTTVTTSLVHLRALRNSN